MWIDSQDVFVGEDNGDVDHNKGRNRELEQTQVVERGTVIGQPAISPLCPWPGFP